ncbi:MAG: retropepsin-like domain-containing protein [Verrucomicrobiales bacterium]|jgi:hypothetical protein|nr:retropepsin-like domain-containing protein [Verrucomicrobiales bacterium]
MPHLTLPIDARLGAIIRLEIGVSAQRATALRKVDAAIPPPVSISLLIDTGASCTVVNEAALKPLGLPPRGATLIRTPSTGQNPTARNTYDISLRLTHADGGRFFNSVLVVATDFHGQNLDGLLGRDVLEKCLLVYNGEHKMFALSF